MDDPWVINVVASWHITAPAIAAPSVTQVAFRGVNPPNIEDMTPIVSLERKKCNKEENKKSPSTIFAASLIYVIYSIHPSNIKRQTIRPVNIRQRCDFYH